MSHICPVWGGHLLLNPLRKLLENPKTMLGPHVRSGMTVLEPGCGMGFFTLPLARMVGEMGRVITLDVQPGMLASLAKRAERAGLADRIEGRLIDPDRLELSDLEGRADLVAAIHMVHETPDPARFFQAMRACLKRGGKLLVVEPRGHVPGKAFADTVSLAMGQGFALESSRDGLTHRLASFRANGNREW